MTNTIDRNAVAEAEISENEFKKYDTRFDAKLPNVIGTDYSFKRKVVWVNAIGFLILHLLAVYGLFLLLAYGSGLTLLWTTLTFFLFSQGILIGAHRLYSHKSFKATVLLRAILVFLQTGAGQNCLYVWARDHRLHHKFSDTDADPHNANRGFFFSHIGWLMSKKHPLVISKGKTIDMSDLEADPIVMFQKKYFKPLYVICALVIPVYTPIYFWNEDPAIALMGCYFTRYVLQLNVIWMINSAAHRYGTRPFDKDLKPTQSALISFVSAGEGWHNYHHAFPWDYRSSEFGAAFNVTGHVIDFCAYLGLAYDLKTAHTSLIKHRALRTGDGSHELYRKHDHNN